MNLNQLKYFKAVCTYQSVSAAADVLHISQPSVSAAIKELETEFGVRLFQRKHNGMKLTKEGLELSNLSENLLEHAQKIEQIMLNLGGSQKTLRLGIPPMIGSLILPGIYRDFVAENPDISPDITEAGSRELMRSLEDGLVDMVFLPHDADIDSKYCSIPVANPEIVCCTGAENKPLGLKTIRPSDLENEPIILFKNSFFQTEKIKNWFAAENAEPNILFQTNQLSTLRNVIENNLATGFLFKELIAKDDRLAYIPLENPIKVQVSLVWNKKSAYVNCMDRFKKYIAEYNPFLRII